MVSQLAVLIYIFILGLCIGSFLNVLIYRLPRSLSIGGRSFCPKCKKKISWYDNIPLLSFLLLGGKCRHCHSPISVQYPLVELITGLAFVFVYFLFPWQNFQFSIFNFQFEVPLELFYGFWIVSVFLVVFIVDLKHEIIPDQITYPAILFTFLFLIINHQSQIINHLLTAFLSCLFFLALYLVTRGRGMGFGDVKFAFLLGLILGWPSIMVALYLAFLTGAFLGVILILRGKRKFGQTIPFGPFLTIGTLIAFFWGEMILKWFTARFF